MQHERTMELQLEPKIQKKKIITAGEIFFRFCVSTDDANCLYSLENLLLRTENNFFPLSSIESSFFTITNMETLVFE